jgi:FAD/FMN-containing dehydrogenase
MPCSGNFHAIMVFRDEEELKEVRKAVDRLVRRALSLEGTCTGEHGVGIGKKDYLVDELGPGTIALMKQIKAAVDPLNLMNPGKVMGVYCYSRLATTLTLAQLYPDNLESHHFKEGH